MFKRTARLMLTAALTASMLAPSATVVFAEINEQQALDASDDNVNKNINNYYQKEKEIELSEQAKRIYEEFKKSNDMFLGISTDEKGIPEISLQPSGKIIENLDLRFVEGNIQELVKYGYLIQINKEVYKLGK